MNPIKFIIELVHVTKAFELIDTSLRNSIDCNVNYFLDSPASQGFFYRKADWLLTVAGKKRSDYLQYLL